MLLFMGKPLNLTINFNWNFHLNVLTHIESYTHTHLHGMGDGVNPLNNCQQLLPVFIVAPSIIRHLTMRFGARQQFTVSDLLTGFSPIYMDRKTVPGVPANTWHDHDLFLFFVPPSLPMWWHIFAFRLKESQQTV